MSSAGLEPPRGTHDFRDALAWGFEKDDVLGAAQHRWMDEAADQAVKIANERKLGGFDDWTHEKLQAARWVKHKADDRGVSVEKIMAEMGEAREWMRTNVYHENDTQQRID